MSWTTAERVLVEQLYGIVRGVLSEQLAKDAAATLRYDMPPYSGVLSIASTLDCLQRSWAAYTAELRAQDIERHK